MKESYDIAIIGSGPGGYVAALHAAHLKKSVCIIEKGAIGGTCLNRGCVPTKAYAASRDVLNKVKEAADFGIDTSSVNVNFKAIFERKNAIVKDTRKSVIGLLRGNRIDIVKGQGKIINSNTIGVFNKKDGANTTIKADNIIIATGSRPLNIPALKIDHENVLTSSDVLKLETLPNDMVIIGGGIIGCEFASIFSSFGVKVTIVELMETILPTIDPNITSLIKRKFKKNGIDLLTGVKVEEVSVEGEITLKLSGGKELTTKKVLVSVGRASNISGIGLEELKIALDGDKVVVDDERRTNIKNIFAIGDIIKGPMLAHKASYDGVRAVNSAFGIKSKKVPDEHVPSVVFTDPEIAYVGLNENEAKDKGIDCNVGKVFYASSSKAHCMGETDGLIKVIAKKDSGVIIGAAICGAHASDLIPVLAVSITNGAKAKDVYETIFAHPTLSELVKEAAEDIDDLAVHKIYKRG
jgi:dihydrolipoamide dehydrogenase